ncbi:MAG: hypothetical protein RR839_01415 [Oscillospiraceae bacterium]
MKINNKYCKNISIVSGCIMIGIVLLIMLVGLFYTPYDFAEIDVANKLDFFSKEHLLGTDNLGRDILSRLMVGARISFIIGGSTVAIGLFFGGYALFVNRPTNKSEIIWRNVVKIVEN